MSDPTTIFRRTLEQIPQFSFNAEAGVRIEHGGWVRFSDVLEALAELAQPPIAGETRVPSAWSGFGDGHDYSRTGKHLPEQCRYCLREYLAARRQVTGLSEREGNLETALRAICHGQVLGIDAPALADIARDALSTTAVLSRKGPCIPICGLATSVYIDKLDGVERCDLCGYPSERNESDEIAALRALKGQRDMPFDLDCIGLAKQIHAGLTDSHHPQTTAEAIALLAGTLRDYTGEAYAAGRSDDVAVMCECGPCAIRLVLPRDGGYIACPECGRKYRGDLR